MDERGVKRRAEGREVPEDREGIERGGKGGG